MLKVSYTYNSLIVLTEYNQNDSHKINNT